MMELDVTRHYLAVNSPIGGLNTELTHLSMGCSIRPIGTGTSDVEDIPSFTSRVAGEYGLTVGEFTSRLITPVLNKPYLINIARDGGTGFFKSSSMLISSRTAAIEFADALSVITKIPDLHVLTMAPWQSVVSTRNLIYPKRRWCPACYHDWLRTHQVIRDPLLWSIAVVKVCPLHRVPLSVLCPACGRSSFHLERKLIPGYCSYCGCWLGLTLLHPDRYVPAPKELWAVQQVSELIGFNNCPPLSLVSHFLERCIARAGCANRISRQTNIPKATIFGWLKEGRLPSLPSLVEISYQLEVPLIGQASSTSAPSAAVKCVKDSKVRISGLFLHDDSTAKEWEWRIQEKIVNRTPPPSLMQVARELDVSARLLRIYTPDLCKEVSQTYLVYKAKERLIRNTELAGKIKLAFRKLVCAGIYPSRRRIEDLTRQTALLRENGLKQAWHKCFGPQGFQEY